MTLHTYSSTTVKKGLFPVLLMLGLLASGCSAEKEQWLFLAHTYQQNPDLQQVDPRVEAMDFAAYELLLLGGDITERTTEDPATMDELQQLFNLNSPNVHWAIGNHDYMQPHLVSEATGKPLFYSFHRKGTTFVVLDSQADKCSIAGQQMDLLKAVCDTIQESSYLILMQHKLCWLWGAEVFEQHEKAMNCDFGHQEWDVQPNNFQSEVLPMLAKVRQRGIQVLCLSGDLGVRAKTLQLEKEGIRFLACGLSRTGESDDNYLVLEYDVTNQLLKTSFQTFPTN